MKDVGQYRQAILEILLSARDEEGTPRLDEKKAKELSEEFSDQELIDGIDFNTPEEVAEMLLDSGL